MSLDKNRYKIAFNLSELKNTVAKHNIPFEDFMKLWYDLEKIMKVVEKPDSAEIKC